MGMGSSGVNVGDAGVSASASMDNIIQVARFFNSGENITKMKELADKEREVNERLQVLGGMERAKDLIAEAEDVRRRADDFRTTTINNAREEAERLKREARSEREQGEAKKKEAHKEFFEREERVSLLERDVATRIRAIETGEAALKSKEDKLALAVKENADLRNLLQGKLAALKNIAAGL